MNAQHLERTLSVFIDHYNVHRDASELGARAAQWSARDHTIVLRRTDGLETARPVGRAHS